MLVILGQCISPFIIYQDITTCLGASVTFLSYAVYAHYITFVTEPHTCQTFVNLIHPLLFNTQPCQNCIIMFVKTN